MKRGARFFVLDQKDSRNFDADYIVLEIPPEQLEPLIGQLESLRDLAARRDVQSILRVNRSTEVWCVRLVVEANHPKATNVETLKDGLPSLLKDSIPRAGRS